MGDMDNAYQLQRLVMEAQGKPLDEAEKEMLVRKVSGMFARIPVVGQHIVSLAKKGDWEGLFFAIGGYIDTSIQNGKAGVVNNVSTNAMANASVKIDFDINEFIELSHVIDKSEGFTDEEKCQLKSLVADMVDSGTNGDHVTFSDRAAKWLGMTADATELWIAFAPTIATILTTLANQLGG